MNPHRLDFATLSLYTLVVKTGSISKAAQFSNLAVGAASKRISDLEIALGTALLVRHSRGVVATTAGEALYRHAQRVLDDVEQLSADLSDYAAGLDGVVNLWANTSAITQFLPQDIPAFMTENPRIRIELEEQNSTDVVMAVLDGRADFGIFADRTPELGLQTMTYRWDRLVLVVPLAHPLADKSRVRFDDVLDYDFVTLSKDTSLYGRMRLETEAAGKRLKVHIQVRSFDAMCLMVEAGLGIAVLPKIAVKPHTKSMAIRSVELSDDWAHRKLLLGARDFSALPRSPRLLLDHLKVSSNENMASLSGGNWG